MVKKIKEKVIDCDNCGKPAKYYLQHFSSSSLWDMDDNEINNWDSGDPNETEYYCEECAEAEGLI